MTHPTVFDIIMLSLTGLTAAYLLFRFWQCWSWEKKYYVWYYMMGFLVLLVSGLLLIFLGYGILSSPYVLTVASLIPLGISMGLAEQYFPAWKTAYKWFATIGFLVIAVTSFLAAPAANNIWDTLKKIAVPLFHGVAGLVIFLGPFFAKKTADGKAPAKDFWWVGIGGALIGIGGIALAFLSAGKPLLGIFTEDLVFTILAPLLLLMTLAFTYGFVRDIKH
jgi:hypothetical protein